MTLSIGHAFRRSVSVAPERVAAVDRDAGVRYSYREWDDRIRRVAGGLRRLGVRRGDRVGVAVRTRIEAGTIFWATQYLGATFVPFNIRAAADELSFLVGNTQPSVLVFSEATERAVADARGTFEATDALVALDATPSFALSYDSIVESEAEDVDIPLASADDPCVILHTSGTTGRPKGVPRSQAATYTSAHSHAIQVRWANGEVGLGLMPIFHTMGLHTLVTLALVNGTWVCQRSFDPEQTLELIESEGLTSLYLVPTVFHDLVGDEAFDEYDVSSVEKLAYAGIPMSEPVLRDVDEAFDPDVFVNHYGSTEVFTYATCASVDEKPGAAGRFGMNPNLRIVESRADDPATPSETVPQGEIGEIIIDTTSPEVFDGYLDRPDANEASFTDGWYYTGDLGYFDDDGDLFIVGRVDDMIISGGENIHPVEIEDLLLAHESIEEVAVVGTEDDRWHEVVTAFVTVDDDPAGREFRSWAVELDEYLTETDELANFKRPRRYLFVDELAKSKVGKVLRRTLAAEDASIRTYADVSLAEE